MALAPTVLVIGNDPIIAPFLEALSAIWLTASGPDLSHFHAGSNGANARDAVIVELLPDGSCTVRFGEESLRLSSPPSPSDLTALVGLVIRISEFERQLRLVEAMEPLGIIACSLAHDANNLLAVLLGSLWELRKTADAHQMSLLLTSENSTLRVAALLKRLLSFRHDSTARNVSINLVVLDLLPTLRSLVGTSIEIRENLAELPLVRWDVVAVEQALINLVANARDALPLGGRIDVVTRVEPDGAAPNRSALDDGSNRAVVLEVTDNGTGMLPETLVRAFEPLYTTKPPGQGTGLGLKSVRRLVQRAGGTIGLDSRPGRGTKVTIRLPSAT